MRQLCSYLRTLVNLDWIDFLVFGPQGRVWILLWKTVRSTKKVFFLGMQSAGDVKFQALSGLSDLISHHSHLNQLMAQQCQIEIEILLLTYYWPTTDLLLTYSWPNYYFWRFWKVLEMLLSTYLPTYFWPNMYGKLKKVNFHYLVTWTQLLPAETLLTKSWVQLNILNKNS